MRPVFDAYARYYDLLYRDKDYVAEARYVASVIGELTPRGGRILELGCGTGAHAEHLARMGYSVHGFDRSEAMITSALARQAALPPDIAARLSFQVGDVRTLRAGKTYDAVISLFHVMSYQTTDADLAAAFDTAAVHLTPGRPFLFDFWYGPAVLAQRPEARVKLLEDEAIKVTRVAEPAIRKKENVVDVSYSVAIEVKGSTHREELRETHAMRYLFRPEVEQYLRPPRWTSVTVFAWLGREPLTEAHWSGCALAIRG